MEPSLEEDQLLDLKHFGMKPMKVMHPDLSNENKRAREQSTTLRAIEEPATKKIRSIVGVVGVANPDPAPNLKDIDYGAAKPSNLHTIQ